MLDMNWVRSHAEEVQRISNQKGIRLDVNELLLLDDQRRKVLHEVERLRKNRNNLSDEIGTAVYEKRIEEAAVLKEQARANNTRLSHLENDLAELQRHFLQMSLLIPNTVSPDTPIGGSDADNVVLRTEGELPVFDFAARDHVELGRIHGIIDIPRGVKAAGSRNYYLRGAGVLLHRAVQQLALDMLIDRGFVPLEVPLLATTEAMTNTGFFPLGQDQSYHLDEEDKWLVGTSEVPLVTYYSGEIVDLTSPIRLAASSICFRSEVGSAGKDVSGLYRVHQFSKVEQIVLCANDPVQSEALLQEITRNAEDLLQMLELPYRVMAVCTGDMSQKTYKQFDIETWMPSRKAYGETHSSSNLLDFQARRSNIRYRDPNDGTLKFCHSLNNTAVATPRILIPLLENHQREDGSIHIPHALRKYMNGLELLVPQATY
ncbi:serine--tRNA ligase [Paenibacillus sp. YPG26]|uniref:serine--tRNA ligase n=1 Tax=Paenibacillus sp. YPG26 TaxID=2878915 RepID=UPI00203EBEDD|nr:serine--tRNA ligase [Paenibacillus sp. YPG26]USB32253.1 serine--tRNA ligase [Paenibacillus sp. YPG26]